MKCNNITATDRERVATLAAELRGELQDNILPFWMERMVDNDRGGFYGRISGDGVLSADADKGAILNARILWTFSAAYRVLGNAEYLNAATRAKEYLLSHFIDSEHGGIYWSVDCEGRPLDTKKQIYAIGFAIYGLSEYNRATGDQQALDVAVELYRTIEKHAYDPTQGGYLEALTREWHEIADMRLSDKDANEKKTMNTHLHILEPYTNLYRVWRSEELAGQIKSLLRVFIDRILDSRTDHLNLFFDQNWVCRSSIVSYGHDIEASWLMHEAALELGDSELLAEVERVIVRVADAAAEGLQPDGSIIYETDSATGHTDTDRHWWPQAEAVVGYFNIFQHFGSSKSLNRAENSWQYIKPTLSIVLAVNGFGAPTAPTT